MIFPGFPENVGTLLYLTVIKTIITFIAIVIDEYDFVYEMIWRSVENTFGRS